jgi:peptide chain release factor subunit 1
MSCIYLLVGIVLFYKACYNLYSKRKLLNNSHFFLLNTGGENGFNQAIELSAETLSNVKFVQEKRLLSSFFDQISQDTGKFVFGIKDTMSCLEMGAVETLIVWENLETLRYVFNNPSTSSEEIKYLNKEQETDGAHFKDKATGADLEVVDKSPVLEWLASNYKKFGCNLEFVTDRSQEGSQFCRGFGGIGGVLRYSVDTAEFEETGGDEFDSDDGSEWSDGDFI